MLKRISIVLLSGFIIFSIGGCGNSNNDYLTENSNNDYNNYEQPEIPSYNIISIEGIGNTYKLEEFNECYVNDLKASIEPAYPGKLAVNYSITMTMTNRFGDNNLACQVRISVYDSSNILVGSNDPIIYINPNETGRTSGTVYIEESGTDYTIKINEA